MHSLDLTGQAGAPTTGSPAEFLCPAYRARCQYDVISDPPEKDDSNRGNKSRSKVIEEDEEMEWNQDQLDSDGSRDELARKVRQVFPYLLVPSRV